MDHNESIKSRIQKLESMFDAIQDNAPYHARGPLYQPYAGWCNFLKSEIITLQRSLAYMPPQNFATGGTPIPGPTPPTLQADQSPQGTMFIPSDFDGRA